MHNYSSKPESVTILYGSETGNAEDYARFLFKRLQYLQLKPTLAALDEYPLKKLVTDTSFLIVICSTTGQGDLPRNSKKFMKFLLKKKLPHDLLNHIHLTSFGLGDSSYSRFNYAIKKIHTRLSQLGCMELSPRCEGNEMSPEGLDGFYKEWEDQLIVLLQAHFPDLVQVEENTLFPPINRVVVDKDGADIETYGKESSISLTRLNSEKSLSRGTIKLNKRITAEDHFQDVRHVIIESKNLEYIPGDTAALYPCNDDKSVDLLIQLQPHWIPFADKPLIIEGDLPTISGGIIDNSCLTLRSLLTHHIDLVAIPSKWFFMTLWHFTDASTPDGDREQEKLKEFSSYEDPEELYNYANRPRRLILETLLEFQDNLKIPLEYVFDLLPKIKPRLFLIASGPNSKLLELVVGLVEYKTMIRRIRRGLCSKWLKLLSPNDDIIISLQKSHMNFTLPDIPNPPLILISPGTGIAPMKSLIEDITRNKAQELYLFYGCRFKTKDYLFEEQWDSLVKQNKLNMFPCFSRDPGSKTKYVQDKLFAEYELIAELMFNQNAIVFVCGSSGKMPKQVRITLAEILIKAGKVSEDEAERYVIEMEDNGRYKEDTW